LGLRDEIWSGARMILRAGVLAWTAETALRRRTISDGERSCRAR
jgi:hypothetical protein